MARAFNFSAGPATLPLDVLEQAQRDLVDYQGKGFSLIEASHRGKDYEEVHNRAAASIRELLGVPDSYRILFLGGGATMQFGMIPMNLLRSGTTAEMTLSGSWAKKALADARRVGSVNVIFDGSDGGFSTLPNPGEIAAASSPQAAYLHITTNETIEGLQWKDFPVIDAPLVADMSSDIMSRPVPVERFGLIYAGAQKNLGPAGVTIVIIRDDLLEHIPDTLPAYLDYRNHAKNNSLYNTPPVFSIYMVGLVLEWIARTGGLEAMAERNVRKAARLYEAIGNSRDFYRCPVDPRYRSEMNVVFRLPTEQLEEQFIREAASAGMSGLKGHRSVGGVRASIYNAMPEEGVNTLIQFMQSFSRTHGGNQ